MGSNSFKQPDRQTLTKPSLGDRRAGHAAPSSSCTSHGWQLNGSFQQIGFPSPITTGALYLTGCLHRSGSRWVGSKFSLTVPRRERRLRSTGEGSDPRDLRFRRFLAMALLVGLLLVLVPSPTSAQGTDRGSRLVEEPSPGPEVFGWAIELRRTGIGPCRASTPARCYTTCTLVVPGPGQARLTRIRTYMWALGTSFVGFQLRAKLIERGQPAAHRPVVDTRCRTLPGRRGVTELLMDTRNISGLVDVTTQWDIQVEYRFDRSGGLSDVVRLDRWGPVNLHCP